MEWFFSALMYYLKGAVAISHEKKTETGLLVSFVDLFKILFNFFFFFKKKIEEKKNVIYHGHACSFGRLNLW
jgi:hypothetical protein